MELGEKPHYHPDFLRNDGERRDRSKNGSCLKFPGWTKVKVIAGLIALDLTVGGAAVALYDHFHYNPSIPVEQMGQCFESQSTQTATLGRNPEFNDLVQNVIDQYHSEHPETVSTPIPISRSCTSFFALNR